MLNECKLYLNRYTYKHYRKRTNFLLEFVLKGRGWKRGEKEKEEKVARDGGTDRKEEVEHSLAALLRLYWHNNPVVVCAKRGEKIRVGLRGEQSEGVRFLHHSKGEQRSTRYHLSFFFTPPSLLNPIPLFLSPYVHVNLILSLHLTFHKRNVGV